MSAGEIIACTCLALAVYHYVAYPLAMMGLAAVFGRRAPERAEPDGRETVALVIAAYNEERVIAAKITDSLALSYPPERLSIIVAADGSSDRTAEIVRAFGDPRIICLHEPQRRGKGHALNRAVATTTCDVVVLSDANNYYSRDAIETLVSRLREPGVGGATGAKRVVPDAARAASVGDNIYWRYESRIKEAESALGGTVAADGEIFAIRRSLYTPIPEQVVNDDLHLTFNLVRRGYRLVYEPRATALEEGSMTIREDFNVKVRMIAGGFQNVCREWRTLLSSGSFLLKFVSHKILRWLMPVFLATLLVASAALMRERAFAVLLVLQLMFYCVAALGWKLSARGAQPRVTYIPFYFVAMNLAAGAGILRWLRGGQSPLWSKAAR